MVESVEYPFLPVTFTIRTVQGDLRAFLDTGFDGFLSLPETYLPRLGQPDFIGRWALADDSSLEAPEFRGTVAIRGLRPIVAARITCLGTEAILGRAVIDRFAITLDHGRRVIAFE